MNTISDNISLYGDKNNNQRSLASLGRQTIDSINKSPDTNIRQLGGIMSHIEDTVKDGALWLGASMALLGRAVAPVAGFATGAGISGGYMYGVADALVTSESTLLGLGALVTVPVQATLLASVAILAYISVTYGINKTEDEIFKKIDAINPNILPDIREKLQKLVNNEKAHELVPGAQDKGVTGTQGKLLDIIIQKCNDEEKECEAYRKQRGDEYAPYGFKFH